MRFHYITAITKSQIKTLVKDGLVQLSLFDKELCEVEVDGIRYILRRNPVMAEEVRINREEKIKKITEVLEKENEYLNLYKGVMIEKAVSRIQKRLKNLNVDNFCNIGVEGRKLILEIDEEEKRNVERLDGCYCLKTDLKKKEINKEKVDKRYRDLSNIEEGFRTMKTVFLETRPVYVRKESRTRGHVFVVMLAYIIIRELKKLLRGFEITIKEAMDELAVVTAEEIKIGKISYQQIPEPRELGENIFKACRVRLPKVLRYNNVAVATRKRLVDRRKLL